MSNSSNIFSRQTLSSKYGLMLKYKINMEQMKSTTEIFPTLLEKFQKFKIQFQEQVVTKAEYL